MAFPFRFVLFTLAILTGVATSLSVFAQDTYDRLDGTGASGRKADVIEWEGNLELHIYPTGSTGGIGAKLDDRTAGKKVMVVAFRFKNQKEVLVRRAILGVPFTPKVKGFMDPTEKEFDKLALSNQDLPAPWKPYALDPAPQQWYPDGDERNDADPAAAPALGKSTRHSPTRAPASAEN